MEEDCYKDESYLIGGDFDYDSIKNERKIEIQGKNDENELLEDLSNFQQYIENLQNTTDENEIFASILNIFNMLHEDHLKEKINLLVEIHFNSIT